MKKIIRGVVKSDKMDKTRLVFVESFKRHKRQNKYIKRTTKCYAHDDENKSKIGDQVEIVENKPISKSKKWMITRIIN